MYGILTWNPDGSLKEFDVYILSNKSMTLYVGMTGDLEGRIWEHKSKRTPGFTARYNITQLVYFESYYSPLGAIDREKEIKGWSRKKKIALIKSKNPQWRDLAADWFAAATRDPSSRRFALRSNAPLDDGEND